LEIKKRLQTLKLAAFVTLFANVLSQNQLTNAVMRLNTSSVIKVFSA